MKPGRPPVGEGLQDKISHLMSAYGVVSAAGVAKAIGEDRVQIFKAIQNGEKQGRYAKCPLAPGSYCLKGGDLDKPTP